MDDDEWADVRRRAAERKAEHAKRMKATAVYALEVYVFYLAMDDRFNPTPPNSRQRIKFKFTDFACIEIMSRNEVEEARKEGYSTSPPSTAPSTGEATEESTAEVTAEATTETSNATSKATSKAASKDNVVEDPSKKDDIPQSPVSDVSSPSSESSLRPTTQPKMRTNSQIKNDPRYFDPRKLLKQKSPSPLPEAQDGEPLQEEGGEDGPMTGEHEAQMSEPANELPPSEIEGTVPSTKAGSKLISESRGGPSEFPNTIESPSSSPPSSSPQSPPEMDEAFNEMQNDPTAIFDNGKSLIFCKEPLALLQDLMRYPLCLIVVRGDNEVDGMAKLPLNTLTDAVNKSVVLTRSIPLSGIISDTVEVKLKKKKVGRMTVEVRLTCFGSTILHKIYVRGNRNDEHLGNFPRSTSPSQRLIVVPMSTTNLTTVRTKSKAALIKSYPSLHGNVQTDISDFPPLLCGSEHMPEMPPKPEPIRTIVEKEEMEREATRIAELTTFPQYKCIDDWEIIFTRNVIRELIAKDRRPFQPGSPDRIYVEKYFPELLPCAGSKKHSKEKKDAKLKSNSKTSHAKRTKKAKGADKELSFRVLPLDETWMNDGGIVRIRRRSGRPPVRTSLSASSASSMVQPPHTLKSMSHVAVNRFNMDLGEFENDSRLATAMVAKQLRTSASAYQTTQGTMAEKSGERVCRSKKSDTQSRMNEVPCARMFNLKHPRIDPSMDKFNPLPEKPLALEIDAPERVPTEKLVQAIRTMHKGIGIIGTEVVPRTGPTQRSNHSLVSPEKSIMCQLNDLNDTSDLFLVQVERGVPLLVPARSTPYWDGHVSVCNDPINCKHFVILHPGFGYYGK